MDKKKQKTPCSHDEKGNRDDMKVPMNGHVISDVLGSYTGMDEDGTAPVQDADDL